VALELEHAAPQQQVVGVALAAGLAALQPTLAGCRGAVAQEQHAGARLGPERP
jgi:hypothetical protein